MSNFSMALHTQLAFFIYSFLNRGGIKRKIQVKQMLYLLAIHQLRLRDSGHDRRF